MTASSRTRCCILLIAALAVLSSASGCASGGLFGAKEPPKQPETVVDWLGKPRPG